MTARKPIVLGASGQQQQEQSGDPLQLPASVAGGASLNMPQGSAPTSPANGDMWTTSAGLFVQIGGATVGPLGTGGGGGGGSGGGALTQIGEFVANGTAGSYTFSSIPQGYTDLVLVVHGRGTASSTQNVVVTLNGVGGTSYDQQRRYSTGGSANLSCDQTLGGAGWGASSNGIFQLPGTNATTGFISGGQMEILGYSQTSLFKTMIALTRIISGLTDGSQYVMDAAGQFRSTSAITSLTAALASGNFATGSIVALYGRGGTAGNTLIQEIAANGSTTTFSFTSIPNSYNGLIVQCNFSGYTSGATLIVLANNDSSGTAGTSGKYQMQRSGNANGSINLQQLLQTGWNVLASAGSGQQMDFQMRLLNYAQAVKKLASMDMAWGTTGSGGLAQGDFALLWDNTAVINELDFIMSAAPTAGKIRLFGIN